jgi:hypothetical protein
VGTSVGLFATAHLDGTNTIWEQIGSQTIGSVVVEFLTFRHNDGLLVVGTHGNGIYQTNITSVGDVLAINTAIDEKNDHLTEINIYPNPTNNKVNLDFTTQKSTTATWVLYNELGKKVKTGSKKLIAGNNQISINMQNIKSGIYFISLEMDEETITKQIIKQ